MKMHAKHSPHCLARVTHLTAHRPHVQNVGLDEKTLVSPSGSNMV